MIQVFLVEDHGLMRAGLKKSLEKDGAVLISGESSTGEEALRLLSDGHLTVDVVVMDIGLPGISGIEATRMLKERSPEIHVIMFTVHQLEEEIFSAFSSGADGYCLKDTSVYSLRVGIMAVSMGSLYIDPKIAHLAVRRIQSSGFPDRDNPLTPREMEVLKLLAEGLTNKEIGQKIQVSLSTVKAHIQSILAKLSATTRADAAVKAIKKGLI
ncbi:MAG: response regulator [Leptospirales bacterium]